MSDRKEVVCYTVTGRRWCAMSDMGRWGAIQ